MSGLNIGADDQLNIKSQLLAEFLSGELGSATDELSSSSISRVILAGNSVTKATKEASKTKGPVSCQWYPCWGTRSHVNRKNMATTRLPSTPRPCCSWMKCCKISVARLMSILCRAQQIHRHYICHNNPCTPPCLNMRTSYPHFTALQTLIGVKSTMSRKLPDIKCVCSATQS